MTPNGGRTCPSLFTGKGSEEVASEAISAGVSDHLQKESGTDQYAILANRIENLVRDGTPSSPSWIGSINRNSSPDWASGP